MLCLMSGSSVTIIAVKMKKQPISPFPLNRSLIKIKAVSAANTGSIAKIKATLAAVVNCWNFVWIRKARAVAKTDVIANAINTSLLIKLSNEIDDCSKTIELKKLKRETVSN